MGITALDPTFEKEFVSTYDDGYNALVTNQNEIDAWSLANTKDRKGKTAPEPQYDHGPEATVFKLGTIDSILMGLLADDMTSLNDSGGVVIKAAESDIMAARLALRGWDNFKRPDGTDVEFVTEEVTIRGVKAEAVPSDIIKLIPLPVVREMGRDAKATNSVTAIQAKKSGSASTPSNSIKNVTAPDVLKG